MRLLKLIVAVGLLASTAACAVYTNDYPRREYYAYAPYYVPPDVNQSYTR